MTFPTVSQFTPSLNLDFTQGTLPAGVSFSRNSIGTRVNSSGLIETVAANTPRFDYDPVTLQAKGLLIEESRSNVINYSAEFDNAYWPKTACSISPNVVISPNGTTNADKIVEDNTAATGHAIILNVNSLIGASTNGTWSVFAKAAERSYLIIGSNTRDNNAATYSVFDLVNGVQKNFVNGTTNYITSSITPAGNGWYRCSLSFANGTGGNGTRVVIALSNTYNPTYTGNNVNPYFYSGDGASGVYLWGAQLEAGSFATSHIPTTSAAVTRGVDLPVLPVYSTYFNMSLSEGTFLCSFAPLLGTNSGSNRFLISSNSGYSYLYQNTSSAATYNNVGGNPKAPINIGSLNKVAMSYKGTLSKIVANGGTISSATQGNWGSPGTIIYFSNNQGFNGWISKVEYFPRFYSDSYLQSLTQ